MARLVRCPKCQKLLVEYPNVPVYQCGGCGIVLRAKNASDSTEEKSTAEPAQMNQPESQSDVGFSDLESFSSPPAPAMQCSKPGDQNSPPASNLDDHPRAVKRRSSRAANRSSLSRDDRNPQVDFVEEAVDRVEDELVTPAIAEEEQTPRVAARSVGSEEDMAERLRHEGIRHAYYDGSISSSDEARSVQSAERKSGKSRRTVKAASNSDLKLHSGSVRSNAARDRASSSKSSFFDADEFQITAENWSELAKDSSSGELHGKVALLRKIDEVREQLVKISVGSEGRENFASAANSWSSGSRRKADPIRKRPTQHCRPVSGAAPFVICGNCAKLLQLPADFPSTRRRGLYKLRCAGCAAVLDLPFPAKDDRSFSEAGPAHAEADDELDSGGGRGVARGNLTPRLHRLMGYDSASDLLLAGESTGNRSYQGNVRAGIPRPPVLK
ncbi:uncharacterized protein LOC121967790 [Zingiber officinale]|uniref:uncharacterized protein LOC121967790 n=1 Tax=Zingiber officinale TaxID=94328 RepID=UPI001C4AE967|nr:uncharacterized protein LOC121967790 [Zingiber officinale]